MSIFNTYTKENILNGAVVYALGEVVAMLILGKFMWLKILGMFIVGGTLYALEIPAYFAWLNRKTAQINGLRGQLLRALLSWLFFNPLWVARHMALGLIFSGAWAGISSGLFASASSAFLWSAPVSLSGNFVIQNFVPLRHRFLASGIFSGLHAVYYALSAVWFA
ncbi:MAG: hypothetical protein EAZ92_07165 [Candidatus Kapaibacterium sp.]|nr:MAG: hypothetical protein EAZ92_07165 [Candidatus Kapabacteria bacterium]